MPSQVEPEFLRIWRVQPFGDTLTRDFTIVGLDKRTPLRDRGRKVSSEYWLGDDLVVRKTFTDILDVNGLLTSVQVHFEWFAEDGSVAEEKTEIVKHYDKYDVEEVYRKRRARQIDFLLGGARGTPIESAIEEIFSHYYNETQRYLASGTQALATAVTEERSANILTLLDIEVPRADGTGLITVRDAILVQIGALVE